MLCVAVLGRSDGCARTGSAAVT